MDTVILDFGDGTGKKKITKADYERTAKVWEEKQKKPQEIKSGTWEYIKQ